jgi:hypothetical protein
MERLNLDVKDMIYIRSEAQFNRASANAFWQTKLSLVTGRRAYLLSLDEVMKQFKAGQAIYLGLRDIALKDIVGSVNRHRDFTRQLLPCTRDDRSKERWRLMYTQAVSGTGFPAIDVYQLETGYFIQNGHERVSVAAYLAWPTIQAYVTLLPSTPLIDANFAVKSR